MRFSSDLFFHCLIANQYSPNICTGLRNYQHNPGSSPEPSLWYSKVQSLPGSAHIPCRLLCGADQWRWLSIMLSEISISYNSRMWDSMSPAIILFAYMEPAVAIVFSVFLLLQQPIGYIMNLDSFIGIFRMLSSGNNHFGVSISNLK